MAGALTFYSPEGAKVDSDGLSIQELEAFLSEIRDEPRWRANADKCADYYDGHQLTNEVLADMKERGIPPIIVNMIQPTVNTVLGMEAKARTDWRVDYDDQRYEEVATALNQKLVEAERASYADMAISDAYASQIKAGLGWVSVTRETNPFLYRYRVRAVHRREIWWDWRKRDPQEWRYLVRKQWFDADQLKFAFPKFAELIGYSLSKWGNWSVFAERLDQDTGLGQAFDIERAFTLEEQDWRDSERKRACAFEVWYRKWVRGAVARLANGRVIELDVENNIRHAQAVAVGAVNPFIAIYPQVRQAIYLGPHRVLDRPTPLPHRKFPYIPFFGFREDLSGVPYGLIRAMVSPQDEINARRSKMLALLSSRRVQMDSDAIDKAYNTIQDVADEASRADSVIVTNPERINRTSKGVIIEDNRDLSAQQFEVLQESKGNVHEVSGVFPPMAGDNRGVPSGIALNTLVDQGTQTLAEINDNYTFSRREVGDQVMEFVKADNLHPHTVAVGEGRTRKEIQLNRSVDVDLFDDQVGDDVTANDVATAEVKVVLEDVPSTPSYRAQEAAQLAEVAKSLPPQAQAFVVPFYLESTNIRNRKKIGALLRKQMGIPEDGAEGDQQQIPPEIQQLLDEREAALQDLTARLDAAMKESEALKTANANKEGELALKHKVADDKAAVDQHRADTERMKVVHAAAAPAEAGAEASPAKPAAAEKTIVAQVVEQVEPALEELTATVRELAREFHERIGGLEKRETAAPKSGRPAAAHEAGGSGGGGAPSSLALGPFHVHEAPPAAKPVTRKVIRIKTPMGDVSGEIVAEEDEEEAPAPAAAKEA